MAVTQPMWSMQTGLNALHGATGLSDCSDVPAAVIVGAKIGFIVMAAGQTICIVTARTNAQARTAIDSRLGTAMLEATIKWRFFKCNGAGLIVDRLLRKRTISRLLSGRGREPTTQLAPCLPDHPIGADESQARDHPGNTDIRPRRACEPNAATSQDNRHIHNCIVARAKPNGQPVTVAAAVPKQQDGNRYIYDECDHANCAHDLGQGHGCE